MAADKIDLEIVTPKGKALSASVDEVTAPSVQGEFGVLPKHIPFLSTLKPGTLTVEDAQGVTVKYTIGTGFAEAGPDRVVILTESCEKV